MFFKQIINDKTGCISYFIASQQTGEAVVIDPQFYDNGHLQTAKELGYHIIYVLDTRVHSHHLTGAREVAMFGGARYLLHEAAEVNFPNRRVKDGQVLKAGELEFKVVHTPGQSPESMCLVLSDTGRSAEPAMLFSGDNLPLNEAITPAGSAEEYASIQKLLALPDYVEVFPGHVAVAKGKATTDRTTYTLGYERRFNPALQLSEADFRKLAAKAEAPAAETKANLEVNRGLADPPNARHKSVALQGAAPVRSAVDGVHAGAPRIQVAEGVRRVGGYDPTAKFEYTTTDVEYLRLGDMSLMARIYRPEGPGPFPAIMDIHGGAWTTGDRFQNRLIDEVLVESGLLVVALDHRLSPAHPYPAQVQDVNFGIRWAKAHVAEYGGLPSPLGAMGTSSGGHILMLNAMRPHDPVFSAHPLPERPDLDCSIDYYLGLWVPIDPLARYRYQKATQAVPHLIGNSEAFFGSEEKMREGNPQTILDEGTFEQLPPALLVEPFPDEFVPAEIPQRFEDSYRGKSGFIERYRFTGVPHGFVRTDGRETENALNAMKEFIARQLAG